VCARMQGKPSLSLSRDVLFAGCSFSMTLRVPAAPIGVGLHALFRTLLTARFRVLGVAPPEEVAAAAATAASSSPPVYLPAVCPECGVVSIAVATRIPGGVGAATVLATEATADQCAVACRRPSAHVLRMLHYDVAFIVAEVTLPWTSQSPPSSSCNNRVVVVSKPVMLADTRRQARAALGTIRELQAYSGPTTSIRILQVLPEYSDRTRIMAQSFLPRIATLPGFLNYQVNANDLGVIVTLSRFRNKDSAERSVVVARSMLTNTSGYENPAHIDLIAQGIIRVLSAFIVKE